jgi:type IV fimbrial biogenesis protein FimT
MRRQSGFTLLELMVVLAIAAIIFGMAVPSFMQLSIRNRIVGYTNDFIGTVNFARSEAIRRAVPVSICPTNDGATCGGSWSTGWIVFANADGDSPAEVDAGGTEPVLKVHEGLTADYTLNAEAAMATDLTYAADGSANSSGILAVCHEGSTANARAIVITRLRPRVAKDTDGNHVPNLDGGDLGGCAP